MPGTLDTADALRALGLPDDPNAPLPDALTLRKAYVPGIRALDGLEAVRQCARVVTQLTGFRGVIRLSLGDGDSDKLTARAREYAGASCLDALDSSPAPGPRMPP